MDWRDERAFEIRGEMGCELRFDSFGKHYNDEGWITAQASLILPDLTCRFSLSFRSGELESFAAGFQGLLEGSRENASLTTLEEQVACTITLNSCRGVLKDESHYRAMVTFEFETDQTFLRPALSELRKVCAAIADNG